MKTHLFKLECLTDLHVGDGETNYSVIDNEVQKDTVLTDVPIIHASGVKGAIKEHFERIWGINDTRIKNIFGDKDGAGDYKFFSALCVARPLRVTDGDRPYVLATGADVLESFSTLLKGLGLSGFFNYQEIAPGAGQNTVLADGQDTALADGFLSNVPGIEIEGVRAKYIGSSSNSFSSASLMQFARIIGKEFAIAKSLRDYDLPARARNQLENGKSKNLWYEEVVPHKSIFYFVIITPTDDCVLDFESSGPVQFGGNASIGNGYTTITEVFSV